MTEVHDVWQTQKRSICTKRTRITCYFVPFSKDVKWRATRQSWWGSSDKSLVNVIKKEHESQCVTQLRRPTALLGIFGKFASEIWGEGEPFVTNKQNAVTRRVKTDCDLSSVTNYDENTFIYPQSCKPLHHYQIWGRAMKSTLTYFSYSSGPTWLTVCTETEWENASCMTIFVLLVPIGIIIIIIITMWW